jgi:succinoglycan biosynthesis protein ExoA
MTVQVPGPVAPQANGSAPQTAKSTAISIVAACRNESKHIRVFLDSLLNLDLRGFDWEIIVADGMSTDGTREQLAEYARLDARIVAIDNPAKTVSCGLNAAIRMARGEIILRMDAHTEYAPDYVKKCVEVLQQTNADNVGGPARTKAEGTLARAIQAAYHSRFSTGGARFHDDSHSGFVDTVPYGCWRKDRLLQLGLFDEQLVRNQDDELNLRTIRSGGKIWQSSEIVSWYRPRTTLSALFRQYFQYGFWKVRVIRKHRVPGSWRHLIPGAFVAVNLILLLAAGCFAVAGRLAFSERTLLLWTAMFGAYILASLVASAVAAARNGWQLFPYLPATFAAFHFSYGLGFLIGSVFWTFARSPQSRLGNLFVGVTR